jgi:hypothetical protein
MEISKVSLLILMVLVMFLAANHGAKAQELHGVLATYNMLQPGAHKLEHADREHILCHVGC